MGEITKLSILLDGSEDDRNTDEMKAPVVQQGSSPPLKTSLNTRLSLQKGTCTRAPEFEQFGVGMTANTVAYGIVEASRTRRAVVYTTPDAGSRETPEDGTEGVGRGVVVNVRPDENLGRQNLYLPLQISSAGALPGVASTSCVASAYNSTTDELWYAWTSPDRTEPSLTIAYCAVMRADGTMSMSPRGFASGTLAAKVGVTAHGANGTGLWWNDNGTLKCMVVELDGNQLTAFDVFTSIATGQDSDWDLVSQDDTYAYLAGISETTPADGALFKIDITAGTKTSTTFVDAMVTGSGEHCAVAHIVRGGANLIAVAFCTRDNLDVTYGLFNDSLVAQAWGTRTFEAEGRVAVKFLMAPDGGLDHLILAVGYDKTALSDLDVANTDVYNRVRLFMAPLSGSDATIELDPIHWCVLQNQGAQFRVSDTETYPVFFVGRQYARSTNSFAIDPTSIDFVPDPSIEAYIVGNGDTELDDDDPWRVMHTPIARFGVVRGNLGPARTFLSDDEQLAAGPVSMVGTDMFICYRKDQIGVSPGFPFSFQGRFVRLSTAAQQPHVASDKDGATLVAAALPVQWDGVETVELGCSLHAPRLKLGTDGEGVGEPLPTGFYSFVAIYQWTDGTGLTHRSAPSNIETHEFGLEGEEPSMIVTLPDSIRNGDEQLHVDVVLYGTTTNGTSYHLVTATPVYVDGVAIWDQVGIIEETYPQIYSLGTLGEEILPYPPPPLSSIEIVSQRAWGVDAESAARLVFSKMRIPGVGYEFFPAGECHVPSGAGDIVAIREWQGALIIFTQRAIFQIADIGPSNTIGGSGGFGQPAKIADIGCRTKLSVLNTPIGIIFQNNKRGFSLFSGAGVQPLPGALVDEDVTGAFILTSADEACFVVDDEVRVFNYELQRWTTWELPATPTLVTGSTVTRDSALLYAASTGNLYVVRSDSLSTTAVMQWETDWILLGGDFQDAVTLQNVLFNAHSDSDHGVTLELFTNYESTASTSRTYSSAQINSIKNGIGRYTVRVEAVRQDTRAVKVRVTEVGNTGTNQGCRPGALTVLYSVDGLVQEEALNDACQQ